MGAKWRSYPALDRARRVLCPRFDEPPGSGTRCSSWRAAGGGLESGTPYLARVNADRMSSVASIRDVCSSAPGNGLQGLLAHLPAAYSTAAVSQGFWKGSQGGTSICPWIVKKIDPGVTKPFAVGTGGSQHPPEDRPTWVHML